jgi:hypothetical protein
MTERRPQDQRGFLRRPRLLDILGAGGMEEEQAHQIAHDFVRRARAESGRLVEGPAPDPADVHERRESVQHSRDA